MLCDGMQAARGEPDYASFSFFNLLFEAAGGIIPRPVSDPRTVDAQMEMGNMAPSAEG